MEYIPPITSILIGTHWCTQLGFAFIEGNPRYIIPTFFYRTLFRKPKVGEIFIHSWNEISDNPYIKQEKQTIAKITDVNGKYLKFVNYEFPYEEYQSGNISFYNKLPEQIYKIRSFNEIYHKRYIPRRLKNLKEI